MNYYILTNYKMKKYFTEFSEEEKIQFWNNFNKKIEVLRKKVNCANGTDRLIEKSKHIKSIQEQIQEECEKQWIIYDL